MDARDGMIDGDQMGEDWHVSLGAYSDGRWLINAQCAG